MDTMNGTQSIRQTGTGFGLRTSAKTAREESGTAINLSESFTHSTSSELPNRRDIESVTRKNSAVNLSDAQKISVEVSEGLGLILSFFLVPIGITFIASSCFGGGSFMAPTVNMNR